MSLFNKKKEFYCMSMYAPPYEEGWTAFWNSCPPPDILVEVGYWNSIEGRWDFREFISYTVQGGEFAHRQEKSCAGMIPRTLWRLIGIGKMQLEDA
jgi:hypothetical protein